MIGLVAADGCVKDENCVTITSSLFDKHVAEIPKMVENAWDGLVKCYSAPHDSCVNSIRTIINRDKIGVFFGQYIQGKLTKKQFTKDVFALSEQEILHALGGYFDGDGSFDVKNGILVANNYSQNMADQIWWMLVRVGIKANITKLRLTGEHYQTKSTHYYHLIIPSSDVEKITPFMKSQKVPSDFVPRKTRNLRFFHENDGTRFLCQPIETIESFSYTGSG